MDIDSVVATPAVRERFAPNEIVAAFEDFRTNGPDLIDDQTGDAVTVYEVAPGRILFVVEKDGIVEITTIENFHMAKNIRPPYPAPERSGNALGYAIIWCLILGIGIAIALVWWG